MDQIQWWQKSVVYQIYPRSFMDSNGDGIGDLPGIISKLPYLQKLGIDIIWLCPIYKSPNDDNGYDISDYRDIMTEFGTLDDFDKMVSTAHSLGLKIVMDLVVNHSSDEHPWFIESRKDKTNPYRDFYIWRDPIDGHEPTKMQSFFSGSVWQLDPLTNQYYLHCFSKKQPDLNWENPKVRSSVYDMMNWWCERGIDGFRMDVISLISKSELFYKDGAMYHAIEGCNGPRVHEFLREMNHEVLSKHNLITVGETPGVTTNEAKFYSGFNSNELNMVFHFEISDIPGILGKWQKKKKNLKELKEIFSRWQTLNGEAWNSLYWDNHDSPRVVSRFGSTETSEFRIKSAKMLAAILHMQQGTPYIYQGEELGMTNYPFKKLSECLDLETINKYHELVDEQKIYNDEQMMDLIRDVSRDNSRTPMQWNKNLNAGFSTGIPWLPVNPNYLEINADSQIDDPNSVFSFYKNLIHLRHNYPVITNGVYHLLCPDSDELFCYTRENNETKLLLNANFVKNDVTFTVPKEFLSVENDPKVELLLTNMDSVPPLKDEISLTPFETRIYLLTK